MYKLLRSFGLSPVLCVCLFFLPSKAMWMPMFLAFLPFIK